MAYIAPSDITKAVAREPAKKTLGSVPAVQRQTVLAATIAANALSQHQVDLLTAVSTYSSVGSTGAKTTWAGGFVSPTNWASYDAAVKAAQSNRDGALALAKGLFE